MELKHLLVLLPAILPLASAETVLGAYIFHRHGDRTTKAYTPVSLTSLGADQVFAAGSWFRNKYIAANGSSPINGIAATLPVLSQLSVTSPIDTTLENSAAVFVIGLYPPAGSASSQKLANGSDVSGPLGGYQYVPVSAVSNAASSSAAEDSAWLQAGSGCGNAVVSSNGYFASADYLATLASTKDFYQSLVPVVNGTFNTNTSTFKNAYTIYDFINVATIHNTTIPSGNLLTTATMHQLATRADQHEWGLAYNASEPIRAVAGSVLAAQILQSLNSTLTAPVAKASAPKLGIQFGAYASFMSFFGLAQLPAASPDFMGIVNYASSMTFELVTNASLSSFAKGSTTTINLDDVSVRFLFVNGTVGDDNPPRAFPLFGQNSTTLPWKTFAAEMNKFAIGDTASWCKACGNSTGTCSAESLSGGSGSDSGNSSAGAGTTTSADSGDSGVSRPVAGVIGALVTLVVILGLEALVMGLGGLRLAKKSTLAASKEGSAGGVQA